MSNYSGYISGEHNVWHKYPPGAVITVQMEQKPTIKEKIKTFLKRHKTKGAYNMKFKVGDKVRVVNAVSTYKNDIGKIGTVVDFTKTNITKDDGYTLKFCGETVNSYCIWEDHELELVEAKQFTKSDLKDGMVVEYRSGDRFLVVRDHLLSKDYCINMSDLGDDLKDIFGFSNDDIVKVYDADYTYVDEFEELFDTGNLKLIWERKEEPKPTHKFKVGDKVKVRSDLESGKMYGTHHFVSGMKPLLGEVVTIENVRPNFDYYIVDDPHHYLWTDDMFEGLVDYEEMTVAEIEKKLGYKVKIVDGE